MPIQLQCSSVVIRNEALERCLENGVEEFYEFAIEGIRYNDDHLTQASFMADVDAEKLARQLELRGLSRELPNPDFVVVYEADQSISPACDWLLLFEYEGRLVGTLAGSDSRNLVVPDPKIDHGSDSIRHYSREEAAERLEFVRRDDNVDVYRDKETGKLLYQARFTESDDEIFRRAFENIWNTRRQPGGAPVSDSVRDGLVKNVEELQGVAARNPDSGRAYLALGMAWYSLGNEKRSLGAFQKSAELDPEETATLKEWAGVCLALGHNDDALAICRKAVAVEPKNVELLGNLSVSQLLCGEVKQAQQTIEFALRLSDSDEVNNNLAKRIEQIARGERHHPKTLHELMQPMKAKKKSFFGKLFPFGNR